MRADTLYAVEVLPNNVRYYGTEDVTQPGSATEIVAIPLDQLKELMELASENHEFTRSISIFDIKTKDEDELDREIEQVFETIDTILAKTRG